MEQLNQFLNQYKLPLIITFVGLVLILSGLASQGLLASKSSKIYPGKSVVKQISPKLTNLKIDISGAVNNPGVYEMNVDDRVEQAVNRAGGFLDNVNLDFVTKNLNLSQKLTDGQKIYIPFKGENSGGVVAGVSTQGSQPSVNTASQKELEDLPSIGAVSASKIIENRPYQSLDELVTKKVLSKSVFNKIKDLISL